MMTRLTKSQEKNPFPRSRGNGFAFYTFHLAEHAHVEPFLLGDRPPVNRLMFQ